MRSWACRLALQTERGDTEPPRVARLQDPRRVMKYSVCCRYLEIWNDEVFDLLARGVLLLSKKCTPHAGNCPYALGLFVHVAGHAYPDAQHVTRHATRMLRH
jgi:hypothetical protein